MPESDRVLGSKRAESMRKENDDTNTWVFIYLKNRMPHTSRTSLGPIDIISSYGEIIASNNLALDS